MTVCKTEKRGRSPLGSNLPPADFLAAFPRDRIFVTKAETEKGLQKTMKRGKKSGRERESRADRALPPTRDTD